MKPQNEKILDVSELHKFLTDAYDRIMVLDALEKLLIRYALFVIDDPDKNPINFDDKDIIYIVNELRETIKSLPVLEYH